MAAADVACDIDQDVAVHQAGKPSESAGVHSLSDDILAQVLAWLRTPLAVRSGATSRAFSRAGLAVLRCAAWQNTMDCSGPWWCGEPAAGTRTSAMSEGRNSEQELELQLRRRSTSPPSAPASLYSAPCARRDTSIPAVLGTPCLDLRCVGNRVDDAALLGILARAFRATGKLPHTASLPRAPPTPPPTPFAAELMTGAALRREPHQTAHTALGVGAVCAVGNQQTTRVEQGRAEDQSGVLVNDKSAKLTTGDHGASRLSCHGRDVGYSSDLADAEAGRRMQQPPVLQGLVVCSGTLRDEAVQRALHCHGSGLKVLSLAGCYGLTDKKTIDVIQRRCRNLISLDLSDTLGNEQDRFLGRPQSFLNATLPVDALHDSTLRSLMSAIGNGLLFLRLFNCRSVTNAGVEAIADSCPLLRHLDIGIGPTKEQNWLAYRISSRSLEVLRASRCSTSLECLGLRTRDHALLMDGPSTLSDGFPSLCRLDLAGMNRLSDDMLLSIVCKRLLTHIDLSGCISLTDRGVLALAECSPQLAWLSLHGTNVKDDGVRALCESCLELRCVNLSLTAVTARSLRSLAGRDSLRWINLRCCPELWDPSISDIAADLRRKLSSRGPRYNRGKALVMERPQSQFRAVSRHRAAAVAATARSTRIHHNHGVGGPGGCASSPIPRPTAVNSRNSEKAGTVMPARAAPRVAPPNMVTASAATPTQNITQDTGSGSADQDEGDERPKNAASEPSTPSRPRDLNSSVEAATLTEVLMLPTGALTPKATPGSIASKQAATPPPPPVANAEAAAAAGVTVVEDTSPPSHQPSSKKGPLLPAGVGDLSLGGTRRQRRGGGDRGLRAHSVDAADVDGFSTDEVGRQLSEPRHVGRSAAVVASAAGGLMGPGGGSRSVSAADDRRRRRAVVGLADVGETGVLPFDWDAVPRGSGVGKLGAWHGFRGLPGDVAREVILELHPFSIVDFVPKRQAELGVRARRPPHGYQVHTSKFGQAWVTLTIDEQGCVC